jgi:response regulator RpfG family c-di-GMP phosphodiesterase
MSKSRTASQNNEISELLSNLAYVAELKEWDNRAHLARIRSYSLLLGIEIGLSRSESEVIAAACMLHDVGKSLTPVDLLKRLGNYEPNEWKVIEKHTIDGAQILGNSNILEMQTGAIIAEAHHERWNGTGYPYQRKGDTIPLAARICAVADVFDALTTPRPYKQAISPDDARQMIENSSGVLFDPLIVGAFSSIFKPLLKIMATP